MFDGRHTRNGERHPPFWRSGDVGEHTLVSVAGTADQLEISFGQRGASVTAFTLS
jgi:hypothetical protein